MKKHLLLFAVASLLYACAGTADRAVPSADVKVLTMDVDNAVKNRDMSDIVDTSWYKIVPLETTEHSLVGGKVEGVYYRDGKLFLWDRQTESVTVFDDSGKFITKIKARGEGPHEYLEMSDVRLTDDGIFIFDTRGRKVLHYGFDGSFIKVISLKDALRTVFQPNNVFVVGDRIYMTDYMLDEAKIKYGTPHKICAMDMVGDSAVYTKYLPYDVSTAPSYQFYLKDQKYSVNQNGEVYFMCGKTDTIYVATKDDVRPAYVLDFGDKTLPVSMTQETNLREIHSNDQYKKYAYNVTNIRDVGDYLLVELSYTGNMPKRDAKYLTDKYGKARKSTREEIIAYRKKLSEESYPLYFMWYNKKTGKSVFANGMMLPAFRDIRYYFSDVDGNYIIDVEQMGTYMFDENDKIKPRYYSNLKYERDVNAVRDTLTMNSNPVLYIHRLK